MRINNKRIKIWQKNENLHNNKMLYRQLNNNVMVIVIGIILFDKIFTLVNVLQINDIIGN